MYKLTPKELEPGMILASPALTPVGQVLAPEGTEITRQLINRMKLYRVESVSIEGEAPAPDVPVEAAASNIAPSEKAVSSIPKTHAQESKTHSQKVAASDEFREFQIKYFSVIDKLKAVFNEATQHHNQINTADLMTSVSELYRSRNTIIELFDMLYNLRVVDDAIYAHCINVGLIARMFGRWLKVDSQTLDVLTLAGLLHDIGKVMIPAEVLNKPDKLTNEEFALIKSHPKLGYDLLKNQPLDSRVKKAALMHHERCDGSGYPSGLEEDLIDEVAMIIGIADVYDAMTAARSYRSPLCPFQVISIFEEEGFQKYNTKYILTFLNQIAATYQNNRVILSDGRGCNIVMLNPTSLSRPMVQLDDNSIIDLSTQRNLYIKSVL
ncbi:MAG: HD-GYP domain-containing protein [Agathobacter sp.]|nr:HD-GYP domain-containing protein [Agathobacter sp.]